MRNLDEMSVNEIVNLAKTNNRAAYDYLIRKYKGTIHNIIKKRNYFLQDGDFDDLLQEGMIGLYKAIRDFNEKYGEFEVFSKICIDRQLISAIKMSTRQKHKPLNTMIPLDRTLPENDNLTMMDILGAKQDVQFYLNLEDLNPEEQVVLREQAEIDRELLEKALSENEKDVYYRYLEDKSYKEIMEHLIVYNPKINAKMIDNAIQRAKRKIEKIKNNESIHKRKNSN